MSSKTETTSLNHQKIKPFLKWAGGKQHLLKQYDPLFPAVTGRYIEPFIGSGAVYFYLWKKQKLSGEVYLFDNNEELVNAYLMVKNNIEPLIDELLTHKAHHSKTHYYKVRELDRQNTDLDDIQRAARTIYLNKTCYNGLYRVNSKRQFNVPIGRYKNPQIVDPDALRAASTSLQQACIEKRDFRSITDLARAGDFFYFDPPYDPLSKTSSFTSYTENNFNEKDQRDLAEVFAILTRKNCECMLSNSYTPLILDLYKTYRIEIVHASRAINAVASGRRRINEVVVLNY